MNRITNKEYLIDITIKSLQTQQPPNPTKVKCEIHYGDDSYLRIQLQPVLRNGTALFCDERLRIPFSSQVSLVFKLIKSNKKQAFLGHYFLEVQKMLAQKVYHFKVRDKLEESDAYVDFQCKIIDKQLLAESDTDQPELDPFPNKPEGSIITWKDKHQNKLKFTKSLSMHNKPFLISRKQMESNMSLPPQEYGKLVREVEDIFDKKHIFNQRHNIRRLYSRDRNGKLVSQKLMSLKERLDEAQRQKFNSNLLLYSIVSLVAFFIGLKL